MPIEILNEYIGKEVVIYLDGSISAFNATIIEVQDNWIKAEDKSSVRILNGDMISQIQMIKKKKK